MGVHVVISYAVGAALLHHVGDRVQVKGEMLVHDARDDAVDLALGLTRDRLADDGASAASSLACRPMSMSAGSISAPCG